MLIALLLAAASVDSYQSNATLRPACEQRQAICAAYLEGVSDMLSALKAAPGFDQYYCPRPFVNPEELRVMYLAEVRAHPEGANYSAATTVTAVLHEQFPCKAPN